MGVVSEMFDDIDNNVNIELTQENINKLGYKKAILNTKKEELKNITENIITETNNIELENLKCRNEKIIKDINTLVIQYRDIEKTQYNTLYEFLNTDNLDKYNYKIRINNHIVFGCDTKHYKFMMGLLKYIFKNDRTEIVKFVNVYINDLTPLNLRMNINMYRKRMNTIYRELIRFYILDKDETNFYMKLNDYLNNIYGYSLIYKIKEYISECFDDE